LAGLGILLAAVPARAQTYINTVNANNYTPAVAAAVNLATNRVYVANSAGSNAGSVTVINGATDSFVNFADPLANGPEAVAVNSLTNKIYVANENSANVTVIDGSTDTVKTTVTVGTTPVALAVNPLTNMIYVANKASGTVSVISGSTDTLAATVTVGSGPSAVALNPVTNLIYVANSGSTGTNNVSVINGQTNAVTQISDSKGSAPTAVAVNPVTNTAYVANAGSSYVTVITGTAVTADVSLTTGYTSTGLAVNPVTNQIYVTCGLNNAIYIINGSTNGTSFIQPDSSNDWTAVAVDPMNNMIYATDVVPSDNPETVVTVVSGTTNQIVATISDPNANDPYAIAINPVTDKIYVPNYNSQNVSVFDGATYATTLVTDPSAESAAAVTVNPLTNTAYVANSTSNTVTVITGSAYTTSVNVGTDPDAILADPLTNTIYVANYTSNNVSVISGETNTVVATVADPSAVNPYAVSGNPVTNTLYVANYTSNNVSVISGATNTLMTTMADPGAANPYAVTVNPVTNLIYVANYTSGTVSVFTGDTNTLIAAPVVGTNPVALVVNPKTNMIYVANSGSNNVSVINGATNTVVATVTDSSALNPIAIDVNTLTNVIYVANNGVDSDFPSAVTVINGADNTFTSINDPYACGPVGVVVNHVSDKTYVVNSCGGYPYEDTAITAVTVIDGATNALGYALMHNQQITPTAVVANPPAGNIYVADSGNLGEPNATVIAEQQVNTIPITTTVTPLANDQTTSLTPTFTFTATNTLTAAPIDNLLFLEGNWQEPWLVGTSLGGGSFTGTTPKLTPGFHTLYAFATDGEEATSTNTGYGTGPLTGNITAYSFLVPAPEASFSPGSLTFGSGEGAGIPVDTTTPQQTVTLTNVGSYALTVASVALSGTNPGDYAESDNCAASSPIAAQGTCTINVTHTPQAVGARLATLVVTDDSGDKTATQHEVSLTGTAVQATTTTTVTPSANPSVLGQSVTFTATVTPNTPVAPTGTVTFKDGTTTICNAVALSSSQATCAAAALTAGSHSLTAVYSGDSNFQGSTSLRVSQSVVIPTTTQITGNTPNPSAVGQGVTVSFTVTVTPPSSGTFPGTETVTVKDGTGASCTATVATGNCTLAPTAAGGDTLIATFAGDATFVASASTGTGQAVSPATTTTKITGSTPSSPTLGQPLTVSYTVTVNPPAVATIPGSDTVTVTDSTGATCTGTVAAGNCALTPKVVGADSLTATYNGDANFSKSTGSAAASLPILQQGVNLSGLTATQSPDQPTTVGVALGAPATAPLSGTLTLSFVSNASGTGSGYIDPMTCFINSSNQCVTQLNFTIPAGATTASLPNSGTVQQGTTAGTITVTLSALTAGGTSVLPQPAPSLSVTVARVAPAIKSVSIVNETATGFSIQVTAYSTPRDLANATFSFTAAAGTDLNGSSPPAVALSSVSQAYFSSASGALGGGTFVLTVPFTYSGSTSALGRVNVALSNSVGTSMQMTGSF
jgi:YVTN family beta-propeller protein